MVPSWLFPINSAAVFASSRHDFTIASGGMGSPGRPIIGATFPDGRMGSGGKTAVFSGINTLMLLTGFVRNAGAIPSRGITFDSNLGFIKHSSTLINFKGGGLSSPLGGDLLFLALMVVFEAILGERMGASLFISIFGSSENRTDGLEAAGFSD